METKQKRFAWTRRVVYMTDDKRMPHFLYATHNAKLDISVMCPLVV